MIIIDNSNMSHKKHTKTPLRNENNHEGILNPSLGSKDEKSVLVLY